MSFSLCLALRPGCGSVAEWLPHMHEAVCSFQSPVNTHWKWRNRVRDASFSYWLSCVPDVHSVVIRGSRKVEPLAVFLLYLYFSSYFQFSHRVSHCILSCLRTHCIAQTGLLLRVIILTRSFECWDYSSEPLSLVYRFFLNSFIVHTIYFMC